jgi:hypothetical protein
MKGLKFLGVASLIMTVSNVCFALYEEHNNGIYAELAALWFLMMVAMLKFDDYSGLNDSIKKLIEKLS